MLTKNEFRKLLSDGPLLLDGATGSNLRKAGMPDNCVTEEWVLRNPETLVALQRGYAQAGSRIIYAPTFQAQPMALERIGLENHTEAINSQLLALSRSAAPGCLIAGDITTLAAFCDSWDPDNFDDLVANYRRQIRGLVDGGADFLIGETLLYPVEAEAILEELEAQGAAAVGFNCVAADENTPHLVSRLRRFTRLPLICKPNAGNPVTTPQGTTEYNLAPEDFAAIVKQCRENGADLLGG